VSAAAEYADEPSGRELAGRSKHVLECAGLVRVVDNHREVLSLVDGLEAARHARDGRDPTSNRLVRDAEQPPGGERTKRVLEVEPPAQPRLELDARRAQLGVVRAAVGEE